MGAEGDSISVPAGVNDPAKPPRIWLYYGAYRNEHGTDERTDGLGRSSARQRKRRLRKRRGTCRRRRRRRRCSYVALRRWRSVIERSPGRYRLLFHPPSQPPCSTSRTHHVSRAFTLRNGTLIALRRFDIGGTCGLTRLNRAAATRISRLNHFATAVSFPEDSGLLFKTSGRPDANVIRSPS